MCLHGSFLHDGVLMVLSHFPQWLYHTWLYHTSLRHMKAGVAGASENGASFDSWDALESLLPHWESLTDEKKTLYAQMAVLARCGG